MNLKPLRKIKRHTIIAVIFLVLGFILFSRSLKIEKDNTYDLENFPNSISEIKIPDTENYLKEVKYKISQAKGHEIIGVVLFSFGGIMLFSRFLH
jgi:hypothetical protein